jgi:hypothetical protein
MAKRTVLVSDISGQTIDDHKDGATVVITFNDARKGVVKLDVRADKVADLAAKGTPQKRRGRRPKIEA